MTLAAVQNRLKAAVHGEDVDELRDAVRALVALVDEGACDRIALEGCREIVDSLRSLCQARRAGVAIKLHKHRQAKSAVAAYQQNLRSFG